MRMLQLVHRSCLTVASLSQVVNWAFSLLISMAKLTAHKDAGGSTPPLAAASSDGQALVALSGLLRVLWHHINVAGMPSKLNDLLLVAMGLRNLLLVVALPVWARKAVAAQLRAWQQAVGEAQCTDPAGIGTCRPVHLLRVMKEVSGQQTSLGGCTGDEVFGHQSCSTGTQKNSDMRTGCCSTSC
jgi:hypothetical protein